MLQRVLTLALMLCSLAAPVRALDPSTRLSHYVRTVWTEREGLIVRSHLGDYPGS